MTADRQRAKDGSALAAAALAFCLLAWPAVASAQYFGQNKVQYKQFHFQVISSAHFDVYYYQGEDSLALRVLDLAEKANFKLKLDLGHVLERKVPIILYASHNDFQQTNVILEDIGESTGGFTEVLRNRVVIPFPGSYDELRHVVVHELTHAYMFDMLYGGGIANAITKRGYFDIPLWFAEGLAEWESLGWDANAEMFVRDGTISGYLPPLEYGGGYLVYKQGQAAMRFLNLRYGPDRLRDLLQKMKFHRSFDRAFEASMGMSTMHFNQEMNEWLKRTYWPLVREESGPETFARRLTDHRHDRSSLNLGAAISPAGDHIAYFTDRKQFTDVFLMSAIDGQVLKRLVRGERNVSFEALPSFRTSLTWSPDGKKVALVGQSQTRDILYVMDVDKGHIVRRVKLDFDAVSYPAWNPKGDELALVGMKDGRSDLYLLAPDGSLRRLTDDAWDERQPSWTPDGKSLVFSSDRGHPVVLTPERHPGGYGDYGIFQMDVATGVIRRVVDTSGDDSDPVWSPDGRRLAFVSDRGGSQNLYLYDTSDSSFIQLTDLVGGVVSLSWAHDTDRLVFSALNEGGWDIFESKEALGQDSVVTRLKHEKHLSVRSAIAMAEPAPMAPAPPRSGGLGALAAASPDSSEERELLAERSKTSHAPSDSVLYAGGVGSGATRAITIKGQWPNPNAPVDSLPPVGNVAVMDSARAAQPFALPDSILEQKPAPYQPQLASDYAGGGFQYNSGFGFAGSTVLSISDFLGDRRIQVGADIFSSSLRQMNLLAKYDYLPKRTDLGLGFYHFNNYLFSTITALGERFAQPRYFNDETFGMVATASYPFDRFHRVDFALTQMVVNRTFFEVSDQGLTADVTGQERRLVTAPSATLVHDNTVGTSYGPTSGTRSFVNFSPALGIFGNSMQYETAILDYRRYFNLAADYQFAFRGMSAASFGRDAQAFQLGGASTVRGYDDFALVGTRIAFTNMELRFPFLNSLGWVGPIPLGFFNLRGVAFADNAVALNDFHAFRWTYVGPDNKRRLQDLHFSFGGGVRSAIAFLVVKVDVAWKTNFHETSQPVYHFSLGPEF
jgi:Tol biopolymer transport system component